MLQDHQTHTHIKHILCISSESQSFILLMHLQIITMKGIRPLQTYETWRTCPADSSGEELLEEMTAEIFSL